MAGVLDRIKQFARSPQGRRAAEQVRRAASETAIRARSFSNDGCSAPWAAVRNRDRGLAVWKVATIGPSASMQARRLTLGAVGSWACRTSKSCSRSQRRTRAAETGPIRSRATEPL